MPKADFKITEDNTAPAYTITCKRDGSALDLSDATTVTIIIKNKSTGTITQSGKAAVVTSATGGVIAYSADATDFPSKGTYVADIKIDYSGGTTEILYNQVVWKVREKIS